jgi:hypothetical protein
MKNFVQFALTNFTLTLLVIGLVASGIALIRAPKPLTMTAIVEALFSYFLLFSIGFFSLYNFIAHTVFAEMSARFIGWENSPFQVELGFASLGFAVIGFLAFRASFKLRLAAIVGPACFLLGAAGVHIHEMVAEHNFAPGNAGVIFYTDILIPLIGFVLLWLQHRSQGSVKQKAATR